ncbi:hypothetical protein UFOVP708_16 [uncultured Caudovirales phage]|uniref:Uncharacterized protein n=1 Tax=uncultured Caudovirales phage TaxID=2100421 RepID=A0A6J5NI77_9CAUD|nr:hypothetical protein UFOVP708_16 [uncultured Caudovirales phage]
MLATPTYSQAPAHSSAGEVVNLLEHSGALMAYEDISMALSPEAEKRLVEYVKAISAMSHKSISKRYGAWREADRAHDLYVPAEETAFRNKVVISDTRAIADTVLTYFMAAITGRNPMFQLEGLNRSSRTASSLLERVLHQQQRAMAGEARLAQLFLDSLRYGYAPTKCVWSPEGSTNITVNADPRKTFTDPRAPAGAVDRMGFIVFSDHASGTALLRTGLYPKLRAMPGLLDNYGISTGWESHAWHKELGRGWNIDPTTRLDGGESFFKVGRSHVYDEAWICFDGHQLGMPQLGEVWMVVTILDEKAVIRCQLSPYGRQFPCTIGGFGFDAHKTHQQSLYDLLLPLHDLGTWLLRSRVDNVQASLNNLIFADPTRVAIHDLVNRNPWGVVRTMPGTKPGEGVFIANVPDVTRGHYSDIGFLSDMKQRVAAASDAQQGMPTSDGIRSATEIQRLTQLGSQRLGVLSRVLSATTIRPLVRMQVANIQDALTFDGSLRLSERDQSEVLRGMADNGYVDYDISMLQGKVDYMVVDGTLPIEPTRSPETWINILQTVNNAGLVMEYDAGRMVEEAIRSMGVPDVDQFRINRDDLQRDGMKPSQQLAVMEKMRGQSGVMNEENIDRQVQAGNLVPIRGAR